MNDKLFINYIDLIHSLVNTAMHVAGDDAKGEEIYDHLIHTAAQVAHRIESDIEKLDIVYKGHEELDAMKLCLNKLFDIYNEECEQ